MKKAIILINGLGLGNSTRCDVLIDWLDSKKFSIFIFQFYKLKMLVSFSIKISNLIQPSARPQDDVCVCGCPAPVVYKRFYFWLFWADYLSGCGIAHTQKHWTLPFSFWQQLSLIVCLGDPPWHMCIPFSWFHQVYLTKSKILKGFDNPNLSKSFSE